MAGGEGAAATTLEYTPTWVVAAICTVIVALSLAAERTLHYAGKYLIKKKQKPLFEALLKIKEELMLLGFISLLLTVFQNKISTVCIPKEESTKWLPCKLKKDDSSSSSSSKAHFQTSSSFFASIGRRLLAEGDSAGTLSHCEKQGKAPLLSTTALHHLHIFIFVLAVVHVAFCALTILFGGAKIRQWKHWEDSILNKESDSKDIMDAKFTHVKDNDFIRNHFRGIGKRSTLLGWIRSFFKQFYGSVTKSDYITLRHGFIMTHSKGNPKFNFHKYMIRALEADFKKVVGISWYLWLFVVVFLLLNVNGWHAYFWIAFIPFVLLLAVGCKLEHVISQLAQEVAEKHEAIEGEIVVKPSDHHFWLHRPRIVLILIHIILFQNSFELAVFFWIWVQYGFDSCIMGQIGYIIPRLVIGAFVQFFCSYSTLPLYAIVTQMGSSFKRGIFEEHVQQGLDKWAQNAKKKKGLRKAANGSSQAKVGPPTMKEPSPSSSSSYHLEVQLAEAEAIREMEEGNNNNNNSNSSSIGNNIRNNNTQGGGGGGGGEIKAETAVSHGDK